MYLFNNQVCDFTNDCGDHSDELGCSNYNRCNFEDEFNPTCDWKNDYNTDEEWARIKPTDLSLADKDLYPKNGYFRRMMNFFVKLKFHALKY